MSAAAQQKSQLQVKLSVVKGPHAGQVFQFNKSKMTIGRGPENDIVLINDSQVSRTHAQIILVDRDFEIVNLSQKNSIVVQGESVQKWKLINHSTFAVGESEFQIEYDLGQAVVSIPAKKLADVVTLKPKAKSPLVPLPPNGAPKVQGPKVPARPGSGAPQQFRPQQAVGRPQQQGRPQFRPPPNQMQQPRPQQNAASGSLMQNPKFRFYAIAGVILGVIVLALSGPTKKATNEKPKSILKYEDEIDIKLRSTSEKELEQKREDLRKDRNSPQHLRAKENFIKGMRDYQLGNYARAIDFFQVVINLESDHALAKRHLYLSKVRFDELVQAKLVLGESYYKKHNFEMCVSMYQQVMDMLGEGKKDDPKYRLAFSKTQECSLAEEGIR